MRVNKDIFEAIFFARGGEGAKSAAEILAQSATREGKYVQSFPFFGPERSGAPTKIFLRISDEEIRTHEPIVDPDVVVVMDETILDSEDVAKNLDEEESLIVNTKKSDEEIKEKIKFEGKIHLIDANEIAEDVIGQKRPNSPTLGAFVRVTEVVKLESVKDEFSNLFLEKIGKDLTEKNIAAIDKGYEGF